MQALQPVAIAVEACATAAGEAEASGLPREYPRSALKALMLVSGRYLSAAGARLDCCALAVRPGVRMTGRRRRPALVAAGDPGKDARWVPGHAGHPDKSRTRWQALDPAGCWPPPGAA